MNNQNTVYEINRRNFIGAFSGLMAAMGGVAITRSQETKPADADEH